jgi:hypothetical protein
MKNILFLLLLTFSFCFAQDKPLFTKVLKIKYANGDKSLTFKEMVFFQENQKVYGRITIPNTDAHISGKTKLNEASMQTLNSFLKLVEEYRNGCNQKNASTGVNYYEVTIDDENIKIIASCDWKSYTYADLEKKIFRGHTRR